MSGTKCNCEVVRGYEDLMMRQVEASSRATPSNRASQRPSRSPRFAPWLLVVVGGACVSGFEPTGLPFLQTNATRYELDADARGVGVSIPYTFVNATGRPVYLASCGDRFQFRLEKDMEGDWVPVWRPIYPACLP